METCPHCNKGKLQSRGVKQNKRRLQCNRCHKWTYKEAENFTNEVEYGRDFINVVCSSRRSLSEEDIIKQFNIDTTRWELDRLQVKTSEGYRKDRKVEWEVEDGVVTHGYVEDSGKMLVVPMFHIRASFIRKTVEIRTRSVIDDMKMEAKQFAVKYPQLKYPKKTDGVMYELGMPDAHYGRLTWDKETGEDYDIKIAKDKIIRCVGGLLEHASHYPTDEILLPLGNDFYNVNGKSNATAHDTPQQEDTRWQKTFTEGRKCLVEVIDMCAAIAPVKVLIIPGNHDEERMFYLGDALEAWYHACPNVYVDNSPKSRKYHLYGKNLIGFAHGYYEAPNKLPFEMANAVPDLWAQSVNREWHLGDKHNKKDMLMLADEGTGMMVRILRSIAPPDAWTFNKMFKGKRAAEGFVWHKEDGVVAQFTVG